MTIRPQLTATGTAVRLPVAAYAEELLDALALAYTEDSEDVGRLLRRHAVSVLALDHAVASTTVPDHVRLMRAAEADGSREALLADVGEADSLDLVMTADDAVTLSTRLLQLAARIRNAPPRKAR